MSLSQKLMEADMPRLSNQELGKKIRYEYQQSLLYDKLMRLNREENRETDRAFEDLVDQELDAARVNADDTVFVERVSEDWAAMFKGTLMDALAFCKDQRVIDWFAKHGIRG